MVPAMDGDPARRCFLEAGHRDDHHGVLQPFRTFQSAMGEQPVIAEVDAEQPAQMGAEQGDHEAAPAEIAGHESQQRRRMVGGDHENIGPVEPEWFYARGQRQSRGGGEGNGVIGGDQGRDFYCGPAGCRYGDVEIPIPASDAVVSRKPRSLIHGFAGLGVQTFDQVRLFFRNLELRLVSWGLYCGGERSRLD